MGLVKSSLIALFPLFRTGRFVSRPPSVRLQFGTWLKRLGHVPPRGGFLPGIYVPFFCLNYFKISGADGQIAVDYHQIHKDPPRDLSPLQRLLVYRKRGKTQDPIPERTLLEV